MKAFIHRKCLRIGIGLALVGLVAGTWSVIFLSTDGPAARAVRVAARDSPRASGAGAGRPPPGALTNESPAQLPIDIRRILTGLAGAGTNEPGADQRLSLLRRWASLHPDDAAKWAENLPEGGVRVESLEHVGMVWAEQDSGAALAWAAALPYEEGRERAVRAIGYEAARSNPTNALRAAAELERGPSRNQLMLHAMGQWAAASPVSALLWAEGVKESVLRDELFGVIATAWAQQEPASGMILATRAVRDGDAYRRAMVAVAQRWAQSDPAGARAWVAQIPDQALRAACLNAMAH